jgi:predicted RNA-binding protein YlqC (UPF0109 family)
METNNTLLKIWKKLRYNAKNINLDDDDVEEERNTSKYESYKYKSKTKEGENGHIIFLYLHLRKTDIQVLLDTGKNHSLDDPKNITLRETRWGKTIRYKILVKPEDIKDINPKTGKYTYDDIKYLMSQCYETLNLEKMTLPN